MYISNSADQNLKALKKFIKTDLSRKNDLLQLAPNNADNFDEASKINYTDKLYQSLKYLEFDFKSSFEGFGLSEAVNESLTEFFNKTREQLAIGNYQNVIAVKYFKRTFQTCQKTL